MAAAMLDSVEIDTWQEFKDYIASLHPVRDRYLFRGQSDPKWELIAHCGGR